MTITTDGGEVLAVYFPGFPSSVFNMMAVESDVMMLILATSLAGKIVPAENLQSLALPPGIL
jgi:hypothetical protein